MTVRCSRCEFENPDGAVYCAKCATKLGTGPHLSVTRTLDTTPEGLGVAKPWIAASQKSITEMTTNSTEAYDYCLRGNEEGEKLYLESAIRFYEKAVELFDRYAGTSPGDAKARLAALK
jgi:ABC-type nitrate/sulfonate/bicarbonate transport system substrate-binding protein